MPRQQLPDRRPNMTVKVIHTLSNGEDKKLLVTFGLDRGTGRVREVFCADFKEGTDLHTLVTDACVCLSLLLQHGYDVKALRSKFMPAPKSLLHTLINAAVELEQENG